MADSLSVDHLVLCNGTPKEVAEYLKHLRSTSTRPTAVTASLHDAVIKGSIPHSVFSTWFPIADDAQSIILGLRQSDSLLERNTAIRAFIKALRSLETMTPVWDASGGAAGVAAIMSNLSVDEIKMLCNGIARTASLPRGRLERHAKLTELVNILAANTSSTKENPDTRPLLRYYKRILPACTTDRVAQHEETAPKWTSRQRSILLRTHPKFYQAKFLGSIFSQEDSKCTEIDEDTWTQLINNDFSFGKQLLLESLESGDKLPIEPDEFMHKLVEPLARRLRRRRTVAEKQLPLEILGLLVRLVNRHPALAEMLNEGLTGVIFYVVKFWEMARSMRPQVEQHLADLIKLAPNTKFQSPDTIVPFLRGVNPAVSYRLFRLLIQNLKYYGFDINDTSDSTGVSFKKLEGPWPASLFTTIFGVVDRQASLGLFQRLMALFPNGGFLERANDISNSILDHGKDPDSSRGDSEVLQALLLRRSSTSSDFGQGMAGAVGVSLQERKKKASSSRDSESRAFWAISALNMSIATGSLDLYAETLLWARRFNKDPNTVKEVYASGNLQTTEGLELLSGISRTPHTDNADFDAAKAIMSANKTMLQLLETATMALREPSFKQYDWDSVIALPAAVIGDRFRLANDFQDAQKLTDAKMFEVVWQPTLEFLVEAEQSLLRPGLKRLYSCGLNGLLDSVNRTKDSQLRASAIKFVDELARARNELWQTYRSQEFPAVLTLDEPWPRGLPIQNLSPDGFSDLRDVDLPYIRSRIEHVVFGSPDVLLLELPKDKESQSAIGPCVDSYSFALKAYVNSTDDTFKKQNLVRKAWRHAVDELSGTRMTTSSSLRFWAEQFASSDVRLPPDVEAEIPKRTEPAIPTVDDPKSPTEWNPDPEVEELGNLGSTVQATILDQSLMNNSPWSRSPGLWDEVNWANSIEVPVSDRGSFWDYSQLHRPISGKVTDAIVASLLLALNTMDGSDSSVLKHPFPSEADARYPALYLDQDFLESVGKNYFSFNSSRINYVVRSGPPALLAQVVKSVLQAVEGIEKSESHDQPPIHLAMRLVKLLASGDRPSLAFPFIRDVILNRPSDSAWHRELLNKGFFNTLPPTDAAKLLDMLSDGVLKKLEGQFARAEEARRPGSELATQSAPAVKVTTVKMLVKLLSDAPFVSVASSLDILVGLLSKAQHIDVRVAITETLFNTLEAETASPEVKDRILSLLEKLAVPLAASLNELRPTTEAEWEEAETGGQLPEVANPREQSAAPIRRLFCRLDQRLCNDADTKAKLAEMAIRLVEQSADNNRRWTELFLKKHDFTLPPGETLPLSPVDPDMLKIFPRNPEYFTRSSFQMMRGLVLANIQPSPGIAAITKEIRLNPVIADSNAGKHWLALYGRGEFTMSRYGCTDCLAVMHQNTISREVVDPVNRITLGMLQKSAHEVANGLISGGKSSYVVALFSRMTSTMVDEGSLEALRRWKTTTLPVLQEIIARITELRTPAWQRDPKRHPRELPDTFHLKVSMLAIPPGVGLEQTFVEEVSSLIQELGDNSVPYHARWEHLKHQTLRIHAGWRMRFAHLALLFGSLETFDFDNLTLFDHLRFEMANLFVLRHYDPKDMKVVARLKKMLRSWADCPAEEFRNGAKETLSKLRSGWDKEWLNTGEGLEWADENSGED